MRPEEVSALGDLAGDGVRGMAARFHELHLGIARRVWRTVGPVSLPVRITHDVIVHTAYSAAGEVSRAVVRGGAAVAGLASGRDAGSLEDSPRGRAVIGLLNGAFGDTMHERGNPLALPMTLRHDGQDVELSAARLRATFPDATSRVVVFLHGLGQTDEAWTIHRSRQLPYGQRLQAELGYTPLYVRYNTGRHISENGRDLAALLREMTAAWPTHVQEIALVGHSVGGLVARSACYYGTGSGWVSRVRHVFTLGSPHGGSPLERVTSRAGVMLGRLPETRAIAGVLNARSAGIKDLGQGSLLDEHWLGRESDRLPARRGVAREVPFPATVDHCFVSAPLLRHFDLLNHPAVYEQIRSRLGARGLPAARRALPPPSEPLGGVDQRP